MSTKPYSPLYMAVISDITRAVYFSREAQCILQLQAYKDKILKEGDFEGAGEIQRAIDDFYETTH